MKHALTIAGLALIAAGAASLATVSPATAGGWHSWDGYSAPRHYRRRAYRSTPRYYDGGNVRYYNSPRAYRAACSYGDCACLRGLALSTGNPVWWDKYQACTG
jgi:hypothetical protein